MSRSTKSKGRRKRKECATCEGPLVDITENECAMCIVARRYGREAGKRLTGLVRLGRRKQSDGR